MQVNTNIVVHYGEEERMLPSSYVNALTEFMREQLLFYGSLLSTKRNCWMKCGCYFSDLEDTDPNFQFGDINCSYLNDAHIIVTLDKEDVENYDLS